MVPSLRDGDALIVRHTKRIRRGDIVLATFRDLPDRLVVKRAVAPRDGGWWLASDNSAAAGDSTMHGVADVHARAVLLIRGRRMRRLRTRGPSNNSDALASQQLTYDVAGITTECAWPLVSVPSGYRAYTQRIHLGAGDARWTNACSDVMDWQVKRRSGFRVDAPPGSRPNVKARLWLTAVVGPVRVREPIQIMNVVDEAGLAGFSYGTLRGHPVCGEEAFLVQRDDREQIFFVHRSVIRPAPGLLGAMFPIALVAQRIYRRRYARSLL